jgi:hypothetical protein
VILGGRREAGSRAPYESFCIRPMQNLEGKDETKTGSVSKGIYSVIFKYCSPVM